MKRKTVSEMSGNCSVSSTLHATVNGLGKAPPQTPMQSMQSTHGGMSVMSNGSSLSGNEQECFNFLLCVWSY